MAKRKLISTQIEVNSVNLSTQLANGVLTLESEELDTTCFEDIARRREGGLFNGSLALQFKANQDLTNVIGDFFAILGTVVTFSFKVENVAESDANPKFTGSIFVGQMPPYGGSVGELMGPSVTYPLDGWVAIDVT